MAISKGWKMSVSGVCVCVYKTASVCVLVCVHVCRLWMSHLNQYSFTKTTLFQIYIMQEKEPNKTLMGDVAWTSREIQPAWTLCIQAPSHPCPAPDIALIPECCSLVKPKQLESHSK